MENNQVGPVGNPDSPSRRLLKAFYGYQIAFSMLFWVPIFYEYQRRFGMTDPQILSIQSLYYVAFCLLEIPTGWLADRFGYRKSLVASGAVLLGATLIAIFFTTPLGFTLHFLGVALARSLNSGAASAYLYDGLAEYGGRAAYREIEGRARAWGLAIKVVSWTGVGLLMKWHWNLPYWLSAGSALLSLGFAWVLVPVREQPREHAGFAGDALRAARLLVSSPKLVFLVIQGVAVFVLSRLVLVNLFQPILNARGIPLVQHGMVAAGLTVFEALGSGSPNFVRRLWTDVSAVSYLSLLMAGALAWIASGQNAWAAGAALAVFSLASGWIYPIQRALMNDAIPDPGLRATFLSLESIVDRAVCAAVAFLLGSYLANGRLEGFLWQASVITGILMIGTLVWSRWALTSGRASFITGAKH